MFPRRYAPIVAGTIIGTFMSFIMSAIITYVNTGAGDGFFARWMAAFFVAWVCAAPLAIIANMFMPRIVPKLLK